VSPVATGAPAAVRGGLVAPVPQHTTEQLQWLTPAPLWSGDVGPAASGIVEPWIAELTTDEFVPEFLATLGGTGGRSPADLATTRPRATVDGTDPATGGAAYRLFQPLSRRYYLVCASLVCRRPGIPDHQLVPAANERAFFVMRQVDASGNERGLVDGLWRPVNGQVLLPGEQEHPMHAARVAAFAAPGTAAASLGMAAGSPASNRQVFFGYIPVAGRDALVPPITDPAQALLDVQATMPFPSPPEDPALDELIARVVQPWTALVEAPTSPTGPNTSYASLFLLLDLLDWLGTHLSDVRDRIVDGTALSAGSNAQALYDAINGLTVPTSGGDVALDGALKAVEPKLVLVRGEDIAPPSTTYDLRASTRPATWLLGPTTSTSLAGLARAALDDIDAAPVVPPELQGLIKADPVATAGLGNSGGDVTYVIRTVLVHEPCQPVLSAPTRAFELARALDADAPARPVLLQLPDVNHLRKFNRGVAIEMPPSLRRLLDRVTPDMLKGDGLGPDPGLQLGMICSFSLQIIFLVAFIVMFIFLILLNIVFWWLPFLKICFPVPVKPSTPAGPTP
jgi:hypothetical protein